MTTPMAPLPEFPFDHPSSKAAKTLKRLHEDVLAARARVAEEEQKRVEAAQRVIQAANQRDIAAGREAAGEATAAEYPAAVKELEEAEAAHASTPWDARVAGATNAANRARAAYDGHVERHRIELIEELEAQAAKAVEAVEAAARELAAALEVHQGEYASLHALLPRSLQGSGVVPSTDKMWASWRKAERHLRPAPAISVAPGWRPFITPQREAGLEPVEEA